MLYIQFIKLNRKEGTAKRWIEEIRKVVDGVRRASTHPSESDAPKRLSSSDTSGEEGSGTDLLEFETLTMNLVNQLNSLITEYVPEPYRSTHLQI